MRLLPPLLCAWLAAAALGLSEQPAQPEPVQGMTISCQTWGWEWGTDEMVESMRELKALGVNWICIHPYAAIRGDGSVRWRGEEAPAWLTRPIREAHALGMKILIKPHLAYWGSPFEWRGAITFEDEAQWQRFFTTYQAWITNVAEVCREADAFVVGTELDGTLHREDDWRRVVAGVRQRFAGPLTYAANWTDYRSVPFWDALDVIGIQAYFPLAAEPGLPDPGDLEQAWARWLKEMRAYARTVNRPIVFTELGYCRTPNAAVRPWEGRRGDGEHADETQRRCMTAALQAIKRDELVVGAFLWKWFAGPHTRENFLMTTPAMRQLIREHWVQ